MSTPAKPGSQPASAVLDRGSKRFGDELAVADISLEVPPGQILGVIGPSGAGKTTTVRMFTGAVVPDSGTVRVFGEDPARLRRSSRERIGYMPQQFTLYPDLTARENVDFVATLFGLLPRRRWRRTQETLHLVDLWDVRSRRAGVLSGGMQRRLELACALVHEPDLLFLDEPTAGIDPLLRATVWTELHRLRDAGRTLLVTTQYVTEAEECDRVALIADGRLIADATPEALRRQATDGDILDVETKGPIDPATVTAIDGIGAVRSTGYRSIRVTAADAAAATPAVIDAIAGTGGEVIRIEEVRLSFDDVFATLVERDRDATRGATPDRADVAESAASDVAA
jgi:ABC-2 type transport system ATP-binding protein